jgi:hypothetical protein
MKNAKEDSIIMAIIPAYNESRNILKKRLSVLALVAALVLLTLDSTNPIQAQETKVNDELAVVVTLYGVNNTTGNVVTFVSTNNNNTKGAILNATELDLKDGSNDGVVDVVLSFPNVTITTGEQFRACNMVLKDLSLVCETGHNSPSPRAEYVDLVLVD